MWDRVRRALGRLSRPSEQAVAPSAGSKPLKLFISYAREDRDFAERLYRDLSQDAFDVWWDRATMDSRARTFLQEIRDAVEGAERVVAVVGPEALQSRYVRYEWDHAHLFCRGLVPILRKGAYDSLPAELASLHCEDFRDDRTYDRARSRLVRILRAEVPPVGSVRATPSLPPHFLPRRHLIDGVLATVLADVQRPTVISPREQVTVLHGMAGAGKSVLAAAVARSMEARRAFGDGVVWVSMGPALDVLHKLRVVGSQLGDTERNYQGLELARARLEGLLSDKVLLIVLDDVWDVTHVSAFRSALGPRCRLIITSRDRSIATALGAQEHHLDLLTARPLDKRLIEGAVAEALAETGDVERGLAIASGLTLPLVRLNVMSLIMPTVVRRQDLDAIEALWSQLTEITSEDYVGATRDRVQILTRVAECLLGTDIAEAAMKQAYGLCTQPGLAEAIASGKLLDGELAKSLEVRQARERLAEDLFGGGKGRGLVDAQCLLAEKIARHAPAFGEAGAPLLENASKLIDRAIAHVAAMKETDDRIGALCAIAKALGILGRKAEAESMLEQARALSECLAGVARAQPAAAIAYALASIAEPLRARDMLRRALVSSEHALDAEFRNRLLKAWANALVRAGEVDTALSLASKADKDDLRASILSEAAPVLAMSDAARAVSLAETLGQPQTDSAGQADPILLTNLAATFYLAGKKHEAEETLDLAVSATLGVDPASARLEKLIDVIHVLAEAALGDLAVRVSERMPDAGLRAVVFGAMLRESALRDGPAEDLANGFISTVSTAIEAGEQSYYGPLSMLMAVDAVKGRPNEREVISRISDIVHAGSVEAGEATADPHAMPDVVDNTESRALGILATLGERDGEIGTLRAVNAMRIAAGVDHVPLDALKEPSVARIWEMITADPAITTTVATMLTEIRDQIMSPDSARAVDWLDKQLDSVMSLLVENGLADATWQRIDAVAHVFAAEA